MILRRKQSLQNENQDLLTWAEDKRKAALTYVATHKSSPIPASQPGAFAASKSKLTAQVNEAKAQVIEKDEGFKETFAKAEGYVIFPSVAKGGLGIGAAIGKGQLFEKEKLVGEASLKQVSVGFQAVARRIPR